MDAEREALVLDNRRWAYRIAHRLWRHPLVRHLGSREDVRQQALVGLVRAARTFDPAAGFKFTTYAYFCVRNELLTAARHCGPVRPPGTVFTPEPALTDLGRTRREAFWRAVVTTDLPADFGPPPERELSFPDLSRMLGCLTTQERRVVRSYYFAGRNLRQTASRMQISWQRVHQLLRRAIERMREEPA